MEVVSVIIPVYNAEENLKACIESIVNQTYENLEIILVDDGSTDQSGVICDTFAAKDNRIRVFHLKNGGVANARNCGLESAVGTFITFSDSDDIMDKDYIKKALVAIRDTDYVSCAFNTINSSGEKYTIDYMKCFGTQVSYREYLGCMLDYQAGAYWGANWGKLYHHKIIRQHHIRFESGIAFAEDLRFNIEYLKHVKKIGLIHCPIYDYRIDTDGSLSKKQRNIAQYWDEYLELYHRYTELYFIHQILKQHESKLSMFLVNAYVSVVREGIYNNSLKLKSVLDMCKKIGTTPEVKRAAGYYRNMKGRTKWFATLITYNQGYLIAFILMLSKKIRR